MVRSVVGSILHGGPNEPLNKTFPSFVKVQAYTIVLQLPVVSVQNTGLHSVALLLYSGVGRCQKVVKNRYKRVVFRYVVI